MAVLAQSSGAANTTPPSTSRKRGRLQNRMMIAVVLVVALGVTTVGLRLDSFARAGVNNAPAFGKLTSTAGKSSPVSVVVEGSVTSHQRALQHARTLAVQETDTLFMDYGGARHEAAVTTFLPTAHHTMAGPLCIFVPANAHDDVHLDELRAALHSWADNSVAVFTERVEVVDAVDDVAMRRGIVRVLADLKEWNAWHQGTILAQPKLRRRGATPKTLAGRGQLSIPLYLWLAQLARREGAHFTQKCKWFMKCDTDTYVRRGLIERRVLSGLNNEGRLYLGVPMSFNTRPYHTSSRYINFQYNIGGPGYTFSRGLLQELDAKECVEAMTEEPVLLIHDDVATGYCSTQHVARTTRLDITPTAAASSHNLLRYVAEHFFNSTAVPQQPLCLDCALSLHPCGPQLMRDLHERDLIVNVSFTDDGAAHCSSKMSQCDLKLMQGSPAVVGQEWKPKEDMALMVKYWSVTRTAYLPTWEKPVAERILFLIAGLAAKDGAPQPTKSGIKDPFRRA